MHSRIAALRLLGRREAFRRSIFRRQPCEPNRVAAAPLGLKVLGFVNAGTLTEIHETPRSKKSKRLISLKSRIQKYTWLGVLVKKNLRWSLHLILVIWRAISAYRVMNGVRRPIFICPINIPICISSPSAFVKSNNGCVRRLEFHLACSAYMIRQ